MILDETMRERSIRRVLDKHFKDVKRKHVLDAGCGLGVWTKYWSDKGAIVIAVDRDPERLRETIKLNPFIYAMQVDANSIFQYKFDIVFAKDIIEHIDCDTEFLSNMHENLKPGGKLVITTHNSLSLNYYLEGGYHFLSGDLIFKGSDDEHLRFYNPMRLNTKLTDAGFKPLCWWSCYHLPSRFISSVLTGKTIEWKPAYLVELLRMHTIFPFKFTGWNIGVIAQVEN